MRQKIVLADIGMVEIHQWVSISGHCLRNWVLRDAELRGRVDIRLRSYDAKKPDAFIAADILAEEPALVGFSCYVWSMSRIWKIAAILRRERPDLRIVMGGPEMASLDGEILRQHLEVDFVSHVDEGEEVFLRLLRCLILGEGSLSDVPGIAYRDGNEIRSTAAPPFIDLDSTPDLYAGGFEFLDSIRRSPYSSPAIFLLEASRGCPFTCKYCDWGDRKTRYVSMGKLEREFQALARVRLENNRELLVFLTDADILMHQARGADILRSFLRATQGLACRLAFNTNPTFVNPGITDIIAQAPEKFHLSLGVQSINAPVLKKIDRAFDRGKVERNLSYLRKTAPRAEVRPQLIFGLPGDDLDGFRTSLDWVLRMETPNLELTPLCVLPGAPLYAEAGHLGLRYFPEPPYEVYETPTMSRDDMRHAAALSVYAKALFAVPECRDILISGTSSGADLPYIRRLEKMMAYLRSVDLELTVSGKSDDFSRVLRRVEQDPLFRASLVTVCRRFAQSEECEPSPWGNSALGIG